MGRRKKEPKLTRLILGAIARTGYSVPEFAAVAGIPYALPEEARGRKHDEGLRGQPGKLLLGGHITNNTLSIQEMNKNILTSMEKRFMEKTDVLIKKGYEFVIYRNE